MWSRWSTQRTGPTPTQSPSQATTSGPRFSFGRPGARIPQPEPRRPAFGSSQRTASGFTTTWRSTPLRNGHEESTSSTFRRSTFGEKKSFSYGKIEKPAENQENKDQLKKEEPKEEPEEPADFTDEFCCAVPYYDD